MSGAETARRPVVQHQIGGVEMAFPWNQIVFTIFRLIRNQTDVRLIPNQTENGRYNLISGLFNKISKRFICVWLVAWVGFIQIVSSQTLPVQSLCTWLTAIWYTPLKGVVAVANLPEKPPVTYMTAWQLKYVNEFNSNSTDVNKLFYYQHESQQPKYYYAWYIILPIAVFYSLQIWYWGSVYWKQVNMEKIRQLY